LCQLPPERAGVDEVDKRPLTADFDDGEPLAVPPLELGVPGDVDLVELLAELGPEDLPGALAEVAALRVEEDDLRDRCRG
jgi:hypothetical protein